MVPFPPFVGEEMDRSSMGPFMPCDPQTPLSGRSVNNPHPYSDSLSQRDPSQRP